jgi:hypothetical protein
MIEYIFWLLVNLGLFGSILLAALGAGHLFLRRMTFHSFAERLVFTMAIGLGTWAVVLFCLGLAGLLYKKFIFALTVTTAAAFVVHLYKANKYRFSNLSLKGFPTLENYKEPRKLVAVFLALLVFGYWALLFRQTQHPPIQWDATSNHLVLANKYLTEHRVFPVMGVAQPILPALNHMLFAWGISLRDDILSQMFEHTLMVLVALGLFSWGKREERPMFGVATACLWLAHPLVTWLGRTAYTDIGVACFTFLGLYALRVFFSERKSAWWYLSMSLLGMATGAKLSGLFFLVAGSMFGLFVLVQSLLKGQSSIGGPGSKSQVRHLLFGWGLALIIVLPWYGFIAHETGNPIWPAYPQINRGVWAEPDSQSNYASLLTFVAVPRTLDNFLRLSFDWVFSSQKFQSEINSPLLPLMIVWPISWAFALWSPAVRWWAAWALAFTAFWFFGPQHIRYWLPALPLAGLALCESARWLVEKLSRSPGLNYAVWVGLILLILAPSVRRIFVEVKAVGRPPANAAARENFLTRFYPGYSGVKYINSNADAKASVCIIGGSWLNYYFQPEVIDLISPMYANKRPTFKWPNDQAWSEWLDSKNVDWIYINHQEPQGLGTPKQIGIEGSFWPGYELAYKDASAWVFKRKSISH